MSLTLNYKYNMFDNVKIHEPVGIYGSKLPTMEEICDHFYPNVPICIITDRENALFKEIEENEKQEGDEELQCVLFIANYPKEKKES